MPNYETKFDSEGTQAVVASFVERRKRFIISNKPDGSQRALAGSSCHPESPNLTAKSSLRLITAARGSIDPGPPGLPPRWREAQADHHDRMAKLSDAYASAYEGDVPFAKGEGQRIYFRRRARELRRDARLRRAAAQRLRLQPVRACFD